MNSPSQRISWLLQMAWRDSRRSRSRLFLFMSSIILGVAALVAIQSFGDNLTQDINNQSKELLGADLVMSSRRAFGEEAEAFLDSLGGEIADERSFASMVFFPKTEDSRLVQVRALGGEYPFYGDMKTRPISAGVEFRKGRQALVANSLLLQFDANVGDSIRVGKLMFEIAGSILQVPGESGMQAMVSTPVYIPLADLEATELIRKGSRVNYRRYFRFDNRLDLDESLAEQDSLIDQLALRYDTSEERKEELGAAFQNMVSFLNLVAFIALLLGCVGVASSVSVYVREKIRSVAILRCLGVSGRDAFLIYLIQIAVMGLLGAIIGALLGSQIQLLLPKVLESFLPFQATIALSPAALGKGVLVGLAIAILFALLPLLSIRRVSPLMALRSAFEKTRERDSAQWLVIAGIAIFVFAFSWWQVGNWEDALYFGLFICGAFLLLLGTGRLIMWLARRYFPANWSYLWRQALSNLFRPQNQTLILMVSIGLGTGMIATLFFVQDMLLSRVEFTAKGDQPNMVLFDIQTPQKDELYQLAIDYKMNVQQRVPIVTMRLDSLHGKSRQELIADSVLNISDGTLNREFRATFRDSLIESEKLVEGFWMGSYAPGDSLFISVEKDYARNRLKVELGDPITFNVQGKSIRAYVGSLREVDWERVQTNFLVVFPEGVLETYPQFHVLVGRTPNTQQAADFQRAVMRDYPNVSIMDLELIINTLQQILDKISFVVRFMAFFSISTGFLVLIGSVIVSKYQRMQESVLLRTIGASRRQILSINALEYTFLGGLASGTGILLALLATWALGYFNFDIVFQPSLGPIAQVFFGITALTVLIGLFNSREVINQPPLEVLRKEI
ncbi:MAG: FtsX-like permease family protein [Bacteroidota bacterium]